MARSLLLLFCVFAFRAFAGSFTVSCSFIEVQSGKPIAGLEVELVYNSTIIAQAITDSDGQCKFENLKKEFYSLYIRNMQDVYENGPIQVINKNKVDKNYTFRVRWNAEREEEMLEAAMLRDDPLIQAELERRKAAEESKEHELIYPDVEARFPGGAAKMQKFVSDILRYPNEAITRGEKGRVYLKFVVEPDGNIDMIQVERGISPELDREAMLILLYMPKWSPGTFEGEPTRSFCRMPINFFLY